MLYPQEARAVFMGAIERFNAKNIPLSNGSVARLTGASFNDYGSTAKIGTPANQASLWIPPLSAITVESATAEREIGACESLMSTRLGAAVRPIDTFILSANKEKLSLLSLVSPNVDSKLRAAVVTGAPRFSSSGLITALATSADVAKMPLDQLSAQNISTYKTSIGDAQERVRNYFVDDQTALEWLAGRPGGDPLIVITTEQSFKSFQTYHPSEPLEWFPLNTPVASLDYPLCDIITKSDTPDDLEAAKLARAFLLSDEFKSLASGAGFSAAIPGANAPSQPLGGALRELLTLWPQIRSPSSTVFVVDTSIKTDLTNMETIRRELSLFVDSRPSKEDRVALISASSDPQVMRDLETDPELIKLSISRLTTAGGNAIQDGIGTALSMFDDLSSTSSRRSVVVFTSAKDTSSQTTVEQLTNRASQLVGRRNVDLIVIAIGVAEQDFGELPAVTRKVGGTFVLTDIPSLPGKFYAIARRVQ
ncbi:MAG: hypothetical protein RIS36_2208 [Pseudomonadota bacterium]|jgi:hypothetical protein